MRITLQPATQPARTKAVQPARSDRAGGIVFWVLLFLAMGTLAPSVIVPEWRHYRALRLAEQMEQHRLDQVQRAIERQRRQFDALRTDPAVMARLAQRELNYRRFNEVTVPVETSMTAREMPWLDAGRHEPFVPEPVTPPALIARSLAMLPDYDYEGLFCDPDARGPLMAMSVALLVFVFVALGGKQAEAQPERPVDAIDGAIVDSDTI